MQGQAQIFQRPRLATAVADGPAHGQCLLVMLARRLEVPQGVGILAQIIQGVRFAGPVTDELVDGQRLCTADLALRQVAQPVVDGNQVVEAQRFATAVAQGAADGLRLATVVACALKVAQEVLDGSQVVQGTRFARPVLLPLRQRQGLFQVGTRVLKSALLPQGQSPGDEPLAGQVGVRCSLGPANRVLCLGEGSVEIAYGSIVCGVEQGDLRPLAHLTHLFCQDLEVSQVGCLGIALAQQPEHGLASQQKCVSLLLYLAWLQAQLVQQVQRPAKIVHRLSVGKAGRCLLPGKPHVGQRSLRSLGQHQVFGDEASVFASPSATVLDQPLGHQDMVSPANSFQHVLIRDVAQSGVLEGKLGSPRKSGCILPEDDLLRGQGRQRAGDLIGWLELLSRVTDAFICHQGDLFDYIVPERPSYNSRTLQGSPLV